MFNKRFAVDCVDGRTPSDGAPLMLACGKRGGLTLVELRGSSKVPVRRIDPTEATVRKSGEGPFNAWTGRRRGLWDVCVYDSGGVVRFRMRNKGDALSLKRWVDKYAARKGGR